MRVPVLPQPPRIAQVYLESRVLRGGAYCDSAGRVRCAARASDLPHQRRGSIGFRVARSYP
ncbi:MAG: SUMF1/EgtB/PvdO family nonheme iron enzyme [Rhodopirellula sp.]|nr:SUMF1/EgtB/PvdO family nonheme iron enzyme [Rhodopirellula sp.]